MLMLIIIIILDCEPQRTERFDDDRAGGTKVGHVEVSVGGAHAVGRCHVSRHAVARAWDELEELR